jgi:hypothetical protein
MNQNNIQQQQQQYQQQQNYRSNQIRSPLKFVKGEFRESDYESDYECRIQPIWRPYDSESEEPVYKPVRPGFRTPGKQQANVVQRHAPTQSRPVTVSGPTMAAAAPFELKPGSPPQIGFAPSPDTHRSVSFVESEKTTDSVQRTTHFLSSGVGGGGQTDQGTLERRAEAKRLQRVDEMRKRFEQRPQLVPAESDFSVQTASSQFSAQGIPVRIKYLVQ